MTITEQIRLILRAMVVLGLLAPAAVAVPVAAQTHAPAETTTAVFEGETIDLGQDWGDATACSVSDTGVTCFRTVAELDAYEMAHARPARWGARCSSPLRLYSGASGTGAVLSISRSGQWINLRSHGFDNRTSSYQAGSCRVSLAAGTGGGGGQYAGCRSAYCLERYMTSGWDNRVSSVRNW